MDVLLFDIDGTLLNTGGAGQRAMERALATVFGIMAPTEGISAAGRTDRAITADLFAYHGIVETSEGWTTFQETYFTHLAEILPTLPGRTLPGIETMLRLLSSREGTLLGLLTGNFERGAWLKLGHFGLEQHFVCGGFGDIHHDRDDVARAALQAVMRHRQAAVEPENVWVIGDTPSDVRCARAIGARVVAVATGTFSHEQLQRAEPDFLFADFADPDCLLSLL